MELSPIKVSCHSGYTADEYHKAFVWYEKEYIVAEIIDRWHQTDRDPTVPEADYFKVKTASKDVFLIKHELQSGEWFIVI